MIVTYIKKLMQVCCYGQLYHICYINHSYPSYVLLKKNFLLHFATHFCPYKLVKYTIIHGHDHGGRKLKRSPSFP